MSNEIPRILLAGTHSGSGKTTLTLALVAALRRRGLKVQTFKVGPDYLDPTWLAAASGRPCYNLDGWMCGQDYITDLFTRVGRDVDIAVIEGVMGLFDGAESTRITGSTAEIAGWLSAPVLLTVNVHGMARSIAPTVAGFAGFDQDVCIGGVIANRCGSKTHQVILAEALRAAGLPPLIGGVPQEEVPAIPSRHLGLVTADGTRNCSPAILDAFADTAEKHLDLDEILAIARRAPALCSVYCSKKSTSAPPNRSIRIAVALDEAFHFYYQDLFDALSERGCIIEYFSPLRDESLPSEIDALYLGGGYPEAFARTLSENESMKRNIREFSEKGGPIYAECGGLIYLSKAVTDLEGNRYPLLGILPEETRMLQKLKRLGYVAVTLREKTLWGSAGTQIRGHEFHYSELISSENHALTDWRNIYEMFPKKKDQISPEGFYHSGRKILVSYVHLHLASHPKALDHFTDFCLQEKAEQNSGIG